MTDQPQTVTVEPAAGLEVSELSILRKAPTWRPGSQQAGLDDRVEFADLGDQVAVRDPDRRDAPALLFSRGDWNDLVGSPRPGSVDLR